eukprot:Sspe_Gene.62327::Locus_34922_Transcript_1_1_Confidence_1.000_Length_1331::g.62327::m.62327
MWWYMMYEGWGWVGGGRGGGGWWGRGVVKREGTTKTRLVTTTVGRCGVVGAGVLAGLGAGACAGIEVGMYAVWYRCWFEDPAWRCCTIVPVGRWCGTVAEGWGCTTAGRYCADGCGRLWVWSEDSGGRSGGGGKGGKSPAGKVGAAVEVLVGWKGYGLWVTEHWLF